MKAKWTYAHGQQIWEKAELCTLAADAEAGDLVKLTASGTQGEFPIYAVTAATGIADATHMIAQGDHTTGVRKVRTDLGYYKGDRKVLASTSAKLVALYPITTINREWLVQA